MPIEVRHDVPSGGIAALEYLTARAEERKRRRAQEEALAIQQAQLASQAAAPQPQSYGGSAPASARSSNPASAHAAFLAGMGGGRGGYGGAYGLDDSERNATSVLNNWLDNQTDLQQAELAAQNSLQRAQMGNDANALIAEQQANARLAQEMATGPEWIDEALRVGTHRWSQDQKTERRKLQDSINNVRTDDTLDSDQRAAFIAQQQQKLWNMEPEPIPADEREKSLDEIFDSTTLVRNGRLYQQVIRNGEAKWEDITDDSAAEMEFKQRESDNRQEEFTRRMQEKDQDQEFKARDYEMKARDRYDQFVIGSIERRMDAEIKGIEANKPNEKNFQTGRNAEGKPVTDSKAYAAAIEEHEKKIREVVERYSKMLPSVEQQPAPWDSMPSAIQRLPHDPSQPAQIEHPILRGDTDAKLEPIPNSYEVQTPQGLADLVASGTVRVGDTVQTPKGPRVITQDVLNKLLGR